MYRLYVTDSLWGLAQGRRLSARFAEVIDPKPLETRTPEEIVSHIRTKLEEVG